MALVRRRSRKRKLRQWASVFRHYRSMRREPYEAEIALGVAGRLAAGMLRQSLGVGSMVQWMLVDADGIYFAPLFAVDSGVTGRSSRGRRR